MTTVRERIKAKTGGDEMINVHREWLAGNLVPADEADARVAEAVEAERKSLGSRLAEYYEPHEIELWLTRPQPLLGHKTAVQLIAEGREEELHQLLDQLDSGAYV